MGDQRYACLRDEMRCLVLGQARSLAPVRGRALGCGVSRFADGTGQNGARVPG